MDGLTRPPTSKYSSPFSNPLVTVPNAPITIGIIVTCMFHSFFNFLARSRYLSFFWHSFSFYSVVSRESKVHYFASSLIIIKSGLLAGIRWSVFMLKSHRSLFVAFSRTGSGWCIYHLLVWSNLKNSYTFPSESPHWPSHVSPYTPAVLMCCIRLLYDWWFHLCHHIACICYFVESYLFSLWWCYYYYYYYY